MSSGDNEEIFTTWTYDLDEADACVLFLCGELDASSAPTFLADTRQVVSKRRNVIMDVHLLSYTDSTGVAAMLSVGSAVERAGRKLLLVGSHGLLARILDATQLGIRLCCCEDIDQAVESLRERQD
jgi:anti-anti-sigma factor